MKKIDVVKEGRQVFNRYAAMDAPNLPWNPMSQLQVRLHRFQARQLPCPSNNQMANGVAEEWGELAEALAELAAVDKSPILFEFAEYLRATKAVGDINRAALKMSQGIRGDRDVHVAKAADAVGDLFVFCCQLMTNLRLDYGAVVGAVARNVMQRDWVADPETGGDHAENVTFNGCSFEPKGYPPDDPGM